ncbi:hypothetical protein [Rheinheimera fenheensis]|uniref:hypothetical protein n=1 Tax=Rheinheimera fenheensis TaxID=3152295 RepID=UPI003261AD65
MPLKKDERKQKYRSIMSLMLKGENKKAFDELASMCGEDTGLFVLADYDKAIADAQQAKAGAA